MPFRIDTFKIDGNPVKTPEGFLRVDAVVTRSGVFRYRSMDGSERLELRSDTEVFDEKSLKTLVMVPMTNDHPFEGLVTADNAKALQIGFTGERVRAEKPFIKVPVVITDKNTIADVEAGKRELSCGYFCDVEEEKGNYKGELYTHVQKNIRYNHVAIVTMGRAGPEARLKMDQMDLFRTDSLGTDIAFMIGKEVRTDSKHSNTKNNTNNFNKGDQAMPNKIINGIAYEAAQEVINHCDNLEKQVADLTKQVATIEADRDAHKDRADKAEKEVKTMPQKINDQVSARRELETKAAKVLAKDTKFDTMSDVEIRSAVIASRFPNIKLDDKSDDYVTALFDSAINVQPVDPSSVNNKILGDSQRQDNSQDFHTDEDIDPITARRM